MSEIEIKKAILAVLTTDKERFLGGAPCFYCKNEEELELQSVLVSKVLNGSIHNIAQGCNVIVKH